MIPSAQRQHLVPITLITTPLFCLLADQLGSHFSMWPADALSRRSQVSAFRGVHDSGADSRHVTTAGCTPPAFPLGASPSSSAMGEHLSLRFCIDHTPLANPPHGWYSAGKTCPRAVRFISQTFFFGNSELDGQIRCLCVNHFTTTDHCHQPACRTSEHCQLGGDSSPSVARRITGEPWGINFG